MLTQDNLARCSQIVKMFFMKVFFHSYRPRFGNGGNEGRTTTVFSEVNHNEKAEALLLVCTSHVCIDELEKRIVRELSSTQTPNLRTCRLVSLERHYNDGRKKKKKGKENTLNVSFGLPLNLCCISACFFLFTPKGNAPTVRACVSVSDRQ